MNEEEKQEIVNKARKMYPPNPRLEFITPEDYCSTKPDVVLSLRNFVAAPFPPLRIENPS